MITLMLLHYAYWLHLIRSGNDALREEERIAVAVERYQKAVDWTPPLAARIPVVREPLREALLKQAQILHVQQKREEGLAFVQQLPSRYPFLERDWEYHLWYGNALFLRAIFQEDPQVLLNDLRAAVREYQTALDLNPSSWDARFNFELIKRALLAEGEEGHLQLKLLLKEEKRRERREEDLSPDKIG